MTLVIDEDRIYTTRYTDNIGGKAKQKEVTIEGKEGQKIKITQLSLLQLQEVAGTTGTVTITAQQAGGAEVVLENWTETKTTPQTKSLIFSYIAEVGASVVLRWYLVNSVNTSRAKIQRVAYDADYIQDDEQSVTNVYLLIPCASTAEAVIIRDKLKDLVSNIEIFTKSNT